jgi:hypothetical protein
VAPSQPLRYRCTACGNLTRFDVTTSRRARAFHHYTVGGELSIEEEVVLANTVERVVCRWCNAEGDAIEAIDVSEETVLEDQG